MTRPYLQENINQDGNVERFVANAATTEFTLSGSGGLIALVDVDNAAGPITVFLPLANAAGRNAEVTVQLDSQQDPAPNVPAGVDVTIAGQTFDGNTDSVEASSGVGDPTTFPSGSSSFGGRTYTSNGIDTWVLTAFT